MSSTDQVVRETAIRLEDYSTKRDIFTTVFNEAVNHALAEKWLRAHGFDEFTADVFGRKKNRSDPEVALRTAKRYVLILVCSLIDRYGPTGYDDKPAELSVFEYWLAHVDYERAQSFRFKCVEW